MDWFIFSQPCHFGLTSGWSTNLPADPALSWWIRQVWKRRVYGFFFLLFLVLVTPLILLFGLICLCRVGRDVCLAWVCKIALLLC